ncbi:MAG: flagellar protein [Chloroflexota bacterium]|nr:MAG: flagellar protein [Chloroflexota bacterium]
MILVHRLDGSQFYLNSDQIETIEANPDTVLTLSSQRKFVVRESAREIIDDVVAYRRRVFAVGPHLVDR